MLHHYDRIGLLVPSGRSAADDISRWFYDCPDDLHRGLAEMYLADERFRKNHDDLAPGLARYVRDAILANASRAGA